MTNHIITVDGKTYDLTQNDRAFGLLPVVVQDAIRDWPYGVEQYTDCGPSGWRNHAMHKVSYHPCVIYRCKPAPKVTRDVRFWRPGNFSGCGAADTHRITIDFPGETLPDGEYKGPDGARFIVEALP